MIDTAIMANKFVNSVRLETRDLGVGNGTAPLTHGTAVASILVNEGAAKIVSANVFRGSGEKIFTSADAITGALEWMVEKKVSIINISLVGPRNLVLDHLIRRVIANGHTIVAAAGNGGPSAPPAYPAAVPDVVAVTAVDANGRIYRYANRGAYISVAAFGVGVLAATPNGETASVSGTSFATPHSAAYLARCIGNAAQKVRTQCIRAMEKEAKDLGPPGRDTTYGFGFIE
jgi:subtilisin family serine protease